VTNRAVTTRRLAGSLLTTALLACGIAAVAQPAAAAPILAVDASHPTEMRPGGQGKLILSLGNAGDTSTSGLVTITATLPDGLTATSAADTEPLLPFEFWNCSISGGGQTVTCTGPNGFTTAIQPGKDACEGLSLPKCPIAVNVAVSADLDGEVVTAQVQACGGGTAACATNSDRIRVYEPGPYGSRYGIASINDHPFAVEDVPALPGEQNAFWAGACDRGAKVAAFGDLTAAGGIGSRSDKILAPTVSVPGQALIDAPATPDHCIDWGAMTVQGFQTTIWQSLPWGAFTAVGPGGQFGPIGDYAPAWRLPSDRRAGGHPDGTTQFAWERGEDGFVDGSVDNINVDLPAGFVGNPQAIAECSGEQFRAAPLQCPPQAQVGVIRLHIQAPGLGGSNLGASYDTTYPVYNLEPRPGRVAELGFGYASGERAVTVRLTGRARTSGDYGITAFTGQIPAALVPIAQSITLWGVPWAAENDIWRAEAGLFENRPCTVDTGVPSGNNYIPAGGLRDIGSEDCRALYDPSWGEIKPFLTNETDCNPAPTVRLATDSFQQPGARTFENHPALPEYPQLADSSSNWRTYKSVSPSVTGCESLGFDPSIDFTPTSDSADGATGLRAELKLPQNNTPPAGVAHDPGVAGDPTAGAPGHWRSDAGRATAHLKDTVVRLPAGVSVNPSGATGLEGCSDAGIGVRGTDAASGRLLFNDGAPFNKDGGADGAECPDGSKIGTAVVDTPLLADPVEGDVVLGEPKSTDPESGEMFRLFIVISNLKRGLIAKIHGTGTADRATGQLTTTFANNPELPFDSLRLDIKGGDRGVLALPPRCGDAAWTTRFTVWSGSPAVDGNGAIGVASNCAFGFAPQLAAGTSPRGARASTRLEVQLTRPEGEQTVEGLSTTMPRGLLASLRDVPLCSSGQAAAGDCPGGSRIGMVDGAAGSGTPFVLEKKGDVYLTEGYKGAPYGLLVKVPVEAGPFRGDRALTPIAVRVALQVDRRSAQVTAVSDPLPQIWHGIPLRVRQINVVIDRAGFALNPSDCSAKQIVADVTSPQGAKASAAVPFQASGCDRLSFKPKLTMQLTGKRQTTTGKHPGVKAQVTQRGVGEAGIARARVVLPKSLALDPENAQALCEFVDGTKPDLENHCPKGSIVGKVRAETPLLKQPLAGNVYFVKNVRIDPKTGNQIRTLPMIVAALRGEIAVNLYGESSTARDGRLINTFADVPDAPISRFNLNIQGGRNGILAVTRTRRARINLCKARHVATTRFDGHNGKLTDPRVSVTTPCKKSSKKKQKQKRRR
jgi:hypothetical protein